MTPDDIVERLTRIEEAQASVARDLQKHICDEDMQFAELVLHVRELREVFIAAKGTTKFLGWLMVAIATVAGAYTWIMANIHLSLKG